MEITLGNLRSIRLMLPKCKDEQLMIAARLEGLDQLRKDCIKHGRKLRSLKTALMQDLLTGRKRVTPLLEGATTDKPTDR